MEFVPSRDNEVDNWNEVILVYSSALKQIETKLEIGEGKTGAAMLAIRTGVPILPVYITPERKLFQRTKVYIGEPYMPFTEKRRANAEDYERVTEDIMEHIRAIRDTRAEREVQG